MAFFLRTFGGLRLVDGEGRDVAFPKKGLLLVAYLLSTAEGSASRATLAQFLWNNNESNVSSTNLRKAISRIKDRQNEIDAQFLLFEGSVICVDSALISSDISSVDGSEGEEPFSRLRRIAKLLGQNFLGPVDCQSADFNSWLAEQKKHHSAVLRDALEKVSRLTHTKEQHEVAKNAAILLFRAEPKDQDILQFLLQIFNAEGDVEYFRRYFEQRSNSISRGMEALAATSDTTATRRPAAQARSPSSGPGKPDATLAFESGKAVRTAIPRLVLLPPSNQSSRPDAGIIASSLIEDITIGFCAFNSLQVIAPHSAVQIGHQMEDQVAFFERHAVDYVLDTRISSSGDEVTLFTQLIFFKDNQIIWAERFSLGQMDLVRDRRLISRRIALSVSDEIERYEVTRSYLEMNPGAYHSYLVGRQHLNRLTLPNLRRARKEMKAALRESADFAPALSAIARTYSKEWLLTARGDIDLLKSAETFATHAMEARSDLADGYREFGVAKLLQGAIDQSAEAMELAENLSPHYADVIADHADTLVHCSRPGIALQKIERAIELNPLSPDPYLWTAAGAAFALQQYDVALDYIGQMSDPSLADRLSAANWAMLGHKDKARVFVRRVRETNPDFDVDKWLAVVPVKEQWHRDLYREGLKKAGF